MKRYIRVLCMISAAAMVVYIAILLALGWRYFNALAWLDFVVSIAFLVGAIMMEPEEEGSPFAYSDTSASPVFTPEQAEAQTVNTVEDEPEIPEAQPDPEPAAFCMHCGSKLSPGSKFCGTCGAKVE